MSATVATQHEDDLRKWIAETKEYLISDSLRKLLLFTISGIFHGMISLTGVLTNSLNMIIFIRQGLKDSISVGLWILSFTDFAVSALQLASCLSYLVAYLSPYNVVNPWTLGALYFGWSRSVAYYISCWITTWIAIERLYCVISPFRVKKVFTKAKCMLSVIVIYTIHIGLLVPLFNSTPLEWGMFSTGQRDVNGTLIYGVKIRVVLTEEYARWDTINNLVQGVILSIFSQALIILCTVWMTVSLKASSRVRKHRAYETKSGNSEFKDNLSPRERLMVKIVTLLAIIQTLCNIPRFIVTAVHQTLPGLQLGAYLNITMIMWELSYIFSTVCCAINLFVYLTMSRNFRQHFNHIFHIKKEYTM